MARLPRARDAIAAAERAAERLFERYARLALGRALCSLGDWDGAVGEIESVKDQVPQLFVGMALAPLVVIAMARGQGERVRTLVDEYDDRWGGGSIVSDRDFRMLRGAALAIGRPDEPSALTRLAAGAQDTDDAEWPGWLTIAPARPEHC